MVVGNRCTVPGEPSLAMQPPTPIARLPGDVEGIEPLVRGLWADTDS